MSSQAEFERIHTVLMDVLEHVMKLEGDVEVLFDLLEAQGVSRVEIESKRLEFLGKKIAEFGRAADEATSRELRDIYKEFEGLAEE